MSLIERFTRDVVSKFVWAGLALAAAIGLAYSVASGGQALDQERAVAEGRAVGYVEGVLAPRLESCDLGAPITGQPADSLEAVVRRSIMADERVSRVRIWSTEGTLLFSTDRRIAQAPKEGLNDLCSATPLEKARSRARTSRTAGGRMILSEVCSEPTCPSAALPWPRSTRPMRGPSRPSEPNGCTTDSSPVSPCSCSSS